MSIKLPRFTLLALLMMASGMFAVAQNRPVPADCIQREWKDANGATIQCQIYLPLNYEKSKKYPLVVCLHGAGFLKRPPYTAITAASTALLAPEMRRQYPSIVFVPQTSVGWAMPPAGGTTSRPPGGGIPGVENVGMQPEASAIKLVIQGIADLTKEYSVDVDRIYASGQSMGGVGTWSLIQHHPEVFAAAAPICGVGNAQEAAKIKCPVWVFHGAQDGTVPVHCSRDMVAALKKAGLVEAKYTEYPEGKHDVWTAAWRGNELAAWIFSKRRGQK